VAKFAQQWRYEGGSTRGFGKFVKSAIVTLDDDHPLSLAIVAGRAGTWKAVGSPMRVPGSDPAPPVPAPKAPKADPPKAKAITRPAARPFRLEMAAALKKAEIVRLAKSVGASFKATQKEATIAGAIVTKLGGEEKARADERVIAALSKKEKGK